MSDKIVRFKDGDTTAPVTSAGNAAGGGGGSSLPHIDGSKGAKKGNNLRKAREVGSGAGAAVAVDLKEEAAKLGLYS